MSLGRGGWIALQSPWLNRFRVQSKLLEKNVATFRHQCIPIDLSVSQETVYILYNIPSRCVYQPSFLVGGMWKEGNQDLLPLSVHATRQRISLFGAFGVLPHILEVKESSSISFPFLLSATCARLSSLSHCHSLRASRESQRYQVHQICKRTYTPT